MLRVVVALLLLANLAVFGWTRGWLAPLLVAPGQADREPQRVAAQVRPERVTVLSSGVASAALNAARAAAQVCLESGPMGEAEAAMAESAWSLAQAQPPASAASTPWTREVADSPATWLVYSGRAADPALRNARMQLLRKAGFAVQPVDAPADLAPAIALSRHAEQAEADAALEAFVAAAASQPARAFKGWRVQQLPAPPARYWLRLRRADAEMQARIAALPASAVAGGFRACAER